MIKSFRSKALAELWAKGQTKGIDAKMQRRVLRRLIALHSAKTPGELQVPGFNFHQLLGGAPVRYSVWVNGPWRITFEFEGGDAYRVELEQYH
jgi:toxin HigB-1